MIARTIKIEGYRTLKDVTWNLGKLNIVIGANGSGKSNLLEFLHFAQASASGRLQKFILSQGGFGSLAWDGSASSIRFKFDISDSTGEGATKNEPSPARLTAYELSLDRVGNSASYVVGSEQIDVDPVKFLRTSDGTTITKSRLGHAGTIGNEHFNPVESIVSLAVLTPFGGEASQPLASLPPLKNYLSDLLVLDRIRTDRDANLRTAPVTDYQVQLDRTGQNFVSVFHTLYTGEDREFKRAIDGAMAAAFPDEFEEIIFSPVANQRIDMRIRWKSLVSPQPMACLSDGTIRFLILATALAHPHQAPLIAIDEPETGLHPGMIAVIVALIKDATLRTQVVLTTHSAQLLDFFENETPTVTTASLDNGATVLRNVADSDLQSWLEKFTLGDMYTAGTLRNLALDAVKAA